MNIHRELEFVLNAFCFLILNSKLWRNKAPWNVQGYFLSHPSIEILGCKALCVNCKRAVKEQYGRVCVGKLF